MRHTSPNPTLTSDLLRAVPSVKKDGLEKALVAALLRCSQGLGVKSLVDLLLLLVADQPYVQRFLLCAVKEGRGRLPPCSPEDLQRFIDKVLMGLSNHHISQVYGGLDVCSNSEKSCEDNLTFPAISVAEMLHKGTIFRASKGQPKGVTVMTRAEKGTLFFPTGCTTVDRLLAGSCSDASDDALEGGFRAGLLTEVHGEAGSGKTQLMLQCLLQSVARYQCALCISLLQPTLSEHGRVCGNSDSGISKMKALSNSGLAALYIASGTVPASRLEPLARAALRRAMDMTLRAMSHLPSSEFEIVRAKLEQRVTVNSVIRGVYIRCVRDIEELRQLLCDGTLSDSFSCFGSVGIVVVDSIAGTVSGGMLADGEVHGSAALVVGAVGALLKLFAIREGAAVLVTNQVRAAFPTTHQGAQRRQGLVPALGLQWAVAPHVRVNLRRVNNLSTAARRQLTIMSGPAHRPASGTYLICDEGIRNDE